MATTTSALNSSSSSTIISMTLEKPMGIILTEVIENEPNGVLISDINPTGSAYKSPYNSQFIGSKIISINQVNVEQMMFDDIMQLIISSESPIHLSILPQQSSSSDVDNVETATTACENSVAAPSTISTVTDVQPLSTGTVVPLTISFMGEESKNTILNVKVGDNLRKTLLDNNIELYRGWKKKLGNCGGAGQCTFCAVDVIVDESNKNYWEPRSDYEEKKIGKKMSPNGKLSCLNNIPGPATIVIPPP